MNQTKAPSPTESVPAPSLARSAGTWPSEDTNNGLGDTAWGEAEGRSRVCKASGGNGQGLGATASGTGTHRTADLSKAGDTLPGPDQRH